MYKNGFGALDMLIALVLIAVVFAFAMPALKGVGGGNLRDSSINYESVEQQVDNRIKQSYRRSKAIVSLYQTGSVCLQC